MIPTSVARAVAIIASAALVVLWLLLAFAGPGVPGAPPGAPSEATPPVLLGVSIFSALAVAAAVAAIRDAPLVLILCGGIGLVPVGLYTLLLPWPYRLIGILDFVLVGAGVLILRSGRGDPPP